MNNIELFCTGDRLCHNIFESYELKHFACFKNYLEKNPNSKDYSILITKKADKIILDENDMLSYSTTILKKIHLTDFILNDYDNIKYKFLDYLIRLKPKTKNLTISLIFYLLGSLYYTDDDLENIGYMLSIINYIIDIGWDIFDYSVKKIQRNYFLTLLDKRCYFQCNDKIIEIYKEIVIKLMERGLVIPPNGEIYIILKNNGLTDELIDMISKEFYELVEEIPMIKEPYIF